MGKRFQYSPGKMDHALDACRKGMQVRQAATRFKVPKSTLWNKLKGISPRLSAGFSGFKSFLGDGVENELEDWILKCSRMGFPITKNQLMDSVNKIVSAGNITTPFINGKPGRSWYYSFLKRHRKISQKHAEYVNAGRGSVTKEKIQNWFDSLENNLNEHFEILKEPSRVWNLDETSFNLAPSGQLVIAERGSTVYSKHNKSDKENITTLIAVNAEGLLALTLYKYERIPLAIAKNSPSHWVLGKSDSGWMNSECFFEYMANNFNSFLIENNIKKPVVVFLDGHKSHLTLHLGQFCKANGIILVALYPNSTHILQPLDVAVFGPLKSRWRTTCFEWRIKNSGAEIDKEDVPRVLDKILKEGNFKSNVIAGFKKTGLFPFDKNAPDYKRICEINVDKNQQNIKALAVSDFKHFESKIPIETLDLFKRTEKRNHEWEGPIEAAMLYDVWLSLKKETEKKHCLQTDRICVQGQMIPERIVVQAEVEQIPRFAMQTERVSPTNQFFPPKPDIQHIELLNAEPAIHSIEMFNVEPDVHNIEMINAESDDQSIEMLNAEPDIHRIEIINAEPAVHRIETVVNTPVTHLVNKSRPLVRNLDDLFKDILRYPSNKNVPSKKKFLPSVLTSDEVIKHEEVKIKLKMEAENLKIKKREERIRKTEEKKKLLVMKQKKGIKSKKVKKKGQNTSATRLRFQLQKPITSKPEASEETAKMRNSSSGDEEGHLTTIPGNRDQIRVFGSRGLCFKCGKCISISEFSVPCMICSKMFHEKCVIEELDDQEDQTDIVFICSPCMNACSDSEMSD